MWYDTCFGIIIFLKVMHHQIIKNFNSYCRQWCFLYIHGIFHMGTNYVFIAKYIIMKKYVKLTILSSILLLFILYSILSTHGCDKVRYHSICPKWYEIIWNECISKDFETIIDILVDDWISSEEIWALLIPYKFKILEDLPHRYSEYNIKITDNISYSELKEIINKMKYSDIVKSLNIMEYHKTASWWVKLINSSIDWPIKAWNYIKIITSTWTDVYTLFSLLDPYIMPYHVETIYDILWFESKNFNQKVFYFYLYKELQPSDIRKIKDIMDNDPNIISFWINYVNWKK